MLIGIDWEVVQSCFLLGGGAAANVGSVSVIPSFRPLSPILPLIGREKGWKCAAQKRTQNTEKAEAKSGCEVREKKLIGSQDMRQSRTGADVCHLL